MSKRIDLASIVPVIGTDYPPPFDQPCRARKRRKLGDQDGLTQFGVNLPRLIPRAWSSQRHWHTESEDACILEIGTRSATDVRYYSDIDMVAPPEGSAALYTHRDAHPMAMAGASEGLVA
jgi:uncharacterized cupin superfamily protein